MSRGFLKTMSVGEILDAAFTLYRHHFTTYIKLAAIAYSPAIVFAVFGTMIGSFVSAFAQTIAVIAVMKAASGHLIGEPVSTSDCFKTSLRKWFPVFASQFVVSILITVGLFLLVVPGVLLIAVWFAYQQVLVLEHDWNFAGRSTALAKGAWSKILAVKLVAMLILILPHGILGVANYMTTPGMGTDPFAGFNQPYSMFFASIAIACLTIPFKTLVDTVLYYERRVAVDGYDVELAASQLGDVPGDE